MEIRKTIMPLSYTDHNSSFKAFVEAIESGVFKNFPGMRPLPEAALSGPVAVCMGAAAMVAKNPKVSRRFWSR